MNLMTLLKKFFLLILLPLVCSGAQINLDFTDWNSENNDVVEHDCIHVLASRFSEIDPQQIISYCLSEFPSKWKIEENTVDQKFTFLQLMELGVTNEQLYHWSAPMDVIEHYQFYLNHRPSISNHWFYNCSSSTFGPLCQYSFDGYESSSLSLRDLIQNYYSYLYQPPTMTCYIHVNCSSICLDWRNICDEQIDCPLTGIDEKDCLQLSINQCEDDQYRCSHGHCLPKTFLIENDFSLDCYDQQDIILKVLYHRNRIGREPTSVAEDTICLKEYWSGNPFQSACTLDRTPNLVNLMLSQQSNSTFNQCRYAFQCQFSIPQSIHPSNCTDLCLNDSCQDIIARFCPKIIFIPNHPILFGHIRLAYTKEDALQTIIRRLPPSYICYDHRLCGGFLPNASLLIFENSTCRKPRDFPVRFAQGGRGDWLTTYVIPLFNQLYPCNTKPDDFLSFCNRSIMYRCHRSSKCISNDRIGDNYFDCDYHDDEDHYGIEKTCNNDRSGKFFNCSTKCINRKKLQNGICDCPRDDYGICIDESLHISSIITHLSFGNVCDGFTELIPLNIDGIDHTDETECQFWHCNNTYTRCDGFWNCPNGADEVDCHPSSCTGQHRCISSNTTDLMCLSLGKFHDGIEDCLDSIDEFDRCPSRKLNFYCQGNPSEYCTRSRYLCNKIDRCQDNDYHWWFCLPDRNRTIMSARCDMFEEEYPSEMEEYLCRYPFKEVKELKTRYFALERDHSSDDLIQPEVEIPPLINGFQQRCHRGLPIRVWLNKEKNLTDITCLCPSNFYGNTCQYQNERVRLTLKLLAYSASRRTFFNILVMLIDDTPQRSIHSYQQFSYLYIRDCPIKINVYLLYSIRPKDQTKNYSVRIDVHEKDSLIHRGSFLIPLKFLFLPIQRLAYHLHIPPMGQNDQRCSNLPCVHGQCLSYAHHSQNLTFCHCKSGWSGQYCHIAYTCPCSSDSICAGQSITNQSICICPRNQFGSRCLLDNHICQSKPCLNDGECIPVDEHMSVKKKFFCICPNDFRGDRCEIANTQILLSFHPNITLPLSMRIHFIQIRRNHPPNNGSTFATISTKTRSSIIYWPHEFHLSFLELFNHDYYLILVQTISNTSANISRTILPSDRCLKLNEILGENITQLHPLRRMKSYHIPCENIQQNLSCFYDQTHFCLCTNFDGQRLANCLEFHSQKKFDCFGQGNCVNGGECLQDRLTCPSISICMCPTCFYGKQCQFSTNGFGLSLDGILGYHIQPSLKIIHQPIIVQISVGLTIIMTMTGLIDGILSMITFNSNDLQKIGCGVYLLASSIVTLLLTVLFAVKFLIFIIVQIASVSNRIFLIIQCVSLDYLVRVCLNINQWLHACVAIERAVTSMKGTNFDSKKSKQMSKYVLIVVIIFILLSHGYDPFYRNLLDDNADENHHDQKRIWCFVSYSSNFLLIYHSLINILHFFTPFLINIISGIVIIFLTTRQRRNLQRDEFFRSILFKQIHQHQHVLIAPMILTLLALPRLIISFVSGCMKSSDDAWLFLIGYFISFLPSMSTFIVFVLPSKFYRKEFSSIIRRYRTNIQTRFNLVDFLSFNI